MPMDLHILPRFDDRLSYLCLEHCVIDQHHKSIAFHNKDGIVPVPVATLAMLMLGPGTNITHAAMRVLAEHNCLVVWCGEENVRFYACGMGGTRNSNALLHQAWLASDDERRYRVVRAMYDFRFQEKLDDQLTLQQVRGKEGMRVRKAYAQLAAEHGVEWTGRNYDPRCFSKGDPINQAISAANACLYGLCHAAILSVGLSPAIGFIHTGHSQAFVFDIADLYKLETSVPIAFKVAAMKPLHIEREVRWLCRDTFRESRLLSRIIPDIKGLLTDAEHSTVFDQAAVNVDKLAWWEPSAG